MSRKTKQIAYGAFYLACWIAIFYGAYAATIKPPASCFDHRLNRDEVEADCGGAFCEDCAIRHLTPIKVTGVTFVPAGTDDTATALIGLQNPNSTYGATSFKYHIEFFDSADATTPVHIEDGEDFIYPSESKYRALVRLPFKASAVVRHTETISDVQWKIASALSIPKIQTREVKLTVDNGRAVITGTLRNNSLFPILSAIINGYATDASRAIVAASKTSIQDVAPEEERFFQIVLPLPEGSDPAALRPSVSVEANR